MTKAWAYTKRACRVLWPMHAHGHPKLKDASPAPTAALLGPHLSLSMMDCNIGIPQMHASALMQVDMNVLAGGSYSELARATGKEST